MKRHHPRTEAQAFFAEARRVPLPSGIVLVVIAVNFLATVATLSSPI